VDDYLVAVCSADPTVLNLLDSDLRAEVEMKIQRARTSGVVAWAGRPSWSIQVLHWGQGQAPGAFSGNLARGVVRRNLRGV
jgi:hypothetical protein